MPNPAVSRRQALASGAAALAGMAAACADPRGPAVHRRARNVILIVSDTMRRDALGCYGGRWVRTPHLDAFARGSVRCERAFLGSFPTVPCRHDLLTGRYTFTFKPWSPLDPDSVTLQDVLRQAGVYTSLVADSPHPFLRDYSYQRRFDSVQVRRGQENDVYRSGSDTAPLPCDPSKLRYGEHVVRQYLRNVADRRVEEDYFCARTFRNAADWLADNHRRQPFFLYVDTFDPHEPWDPPRSYVDLYDPGYTGEEVIYPRYDRWADFLSEAELTHCRALYAGEASLVDRWVGHLFETVERLGLYDNTLVLFLADHGFYLGEHGYIGKSLIRGSKYQSLPLYGEVCRVPLLARFPGCRPGTAVGALVQPVHLPATVLDYLGIAAPPSFAAPSAWALLQGKEAAGSEIVVGSPTLSHPGLKRPNPSDRASVTDGRWLLVVGSSGSGDPSATTASVDSTQRTMAPLTGETLAPELYDLESDPGCLRNRMRDQGDRARDLHRRFLDFLRASPMRREHIDFYRTL